MHHCVRTYAKGAAKGDYYLFHIDTGDSQAIAQVSNIGRIIQIYGPCNWTNSACETGRQILSEWGKALKESQCFSL